MLQSSLSQPIASRESMSRPIKWRAACNDCCAAKVKCSGERSGCERCQNIGNRCVYQESRIGKNPGIRAKKRRIQNEENALLRPTENQQQKTHQPDFQILQTSLPPSTPGLASPVINSVDQSTNDEAFQWATTSQLDSSEASGELLDTLTGGTTGTSATSESVAPNSAIDDFMSNLDLDFDEMWNSQAIRQPFQNRQEATLDPPPIPDDSQKLRNENDSRCVMQCCHFISDLETYISAEIEAFQIRLGIARKANGRLHELIGFQQGSRNLRCLMLFNTVCYQIIELLDLCHKTIASSDSYRRSGSFLMLGGIGFGEFGFDEEERLAWQKQRIVKEINKVSEMVRKIKTLAGVGPDHSTSEATPLAAARGNCYNDLEARIKELAAKVTIPKA
ncbi:hypothetical protein CC78DRAFT_579621 [Lojkania enalia]|uniref:Zn(2)-C6 fungal-type domain-containing protein n=1 Tax=Lojkania enalia TaxID=147567 RepID=A0A9P4N6V2_9PLEO|nr:hypothetical protein CC78DRAFT_579621 [Didymosphaeria enalia]